MLTVGNVTAPIGHTRGLPIPGSPVPIRPVQRRNTSPFTTTAPAAPDPDAIARLERLGYVTVQAVVVDEKPMKLVTRRKGRRATTRRSNPGVQPLRRADLDPAALAAEYAAGATLAQLAAKHHAAQETIRARIRAAGTTLRGPSDRTERAKVTTGRILELHEQGLSAKDIAAEVGLSDVTVGNRLRDAGIVVGRGHTAIFDEERGVALAREGATAYAIAKTLGTNRRAVISRLRAHGITFGTVEQRRADIDRLLELGRAGLTITQIADELEVSVRTVSTHLHRAGITPPDGRAGNTNAPRTDITADVLAADYRAGFSIGEIVKRHGVSPATVRRRLATVNGLEWRDDRLTRNGGANRTSADVEDVIVEEYQTGLHAKEVAQKLDVPTSTVLHVLARRGIPRRSAGESQRGRPGVDGAAGLRELMRSNDVTPADVRSWAAAAGRTVTPRGLPPRRLVEDYLLDRRSAGQRTA